MNKTRSNNFQKAELAHKNFVNYQSSLHIYQFAFIIPALLLLLIISGGLSSLTAVFATSPFGVSVLSLSSIVSGILTSLLVFIGLIITLQKGFSVFFSLGVIALAALGITALVFGTSGIVDALFLIFFIIGSQSLSLWLSGIAIASGLILSRKILPILVLPSYLGMVATLFVIGQSIASIKLNWMDVCLAMGVSSTGAMIGWNALLESTKHPRIKKIAVYLTSIGGTSFKDANLFEADFSGASLRYADFRNANLTRVNWRDVKGLQFSRLEGTYLFNPLIRQLVITGNAQGRKLDGLDLSGVNLEGGNFQDASLVGTNLNYSSLKSADFSRAILKQTQLKGTDLTGATLTGAYIEDWGITNTTNLQGVQCDHVYMQVPTKKNPNPLRKPDDIEEKFSEGEFSDFIQPFFDTLDLYHCQNIDPRAISIALKKLSADCPEADLQFVAIERRGNGGVSLRFKTADGANKSKLHKKYFTNYHRVQKELPPDIQATLAGQNAEIRTLKETIEKFIQTGTHHYSTVQAKNIQIQGAVNMTENKGVNIRTGDNANISGVSSGSGVVNLGTISGHISSAINSLPDDKYESDKPTLKQLLVQLKEVIQTDNDLPEADKLDLLEQIQNFVEAHKTTSFEEKERLTRRALKMFNATLNSLPDTAKIAEACSTLLPLILKTLGLTI